MKYPVVAAMVVAWCLGAQPGVAQTATSDDLFDGNSLHDVWVHINARDWDELRANYLTNTYYPCDFEWRGLRVSNAGCRSRGTGSRNPAKPGLLVRFGHYVAGQQFLGLTSLVLDNNWPDPSMLKERLSMLVFRRMGLAAPREVHARVFVGSGKDFGGVYTLVEDIEKPFLRDQFGTDAGYLHEYRWKDEYRFEDLGPDLEPYAVRFEPRTHEHESPFAMYAPIRDMVRAMVAASPSDLADTLSPHLDMDVFLAHLAVENFLAEWDGLVGYAGMNNFYLYRPQEQQPARIIAWDKDQTFTWPEMPPWHNLDTNVLTVKVWQSPALRTVYLRKLVDTAAADGWLEAEASREYAQIREAVLEDPLKPASNDEFERAVEEVRRFARDRAAVVRRFIAQLAPGLLR